MRSSIKGVSIGASIETSTITPVPNWRAAFMARASLPFSLWRRSAFPIIRTMSSSTASPIASASLVSHRRHLTNMSSTGRLMNLAAAGDCTARISRGAFQ